MPSKQPMPGLGQFQWNTGAWFGSQLGRTAWLLVGATLLALQAIWVAVCWLASFVLANAIGTWLWRRRDRLRPYPALQLLCIVCAACGLLALLVLDLIAPEGVRLNLAVEDGHVSLADHSKSALRSAHFILLLMVPLGLGFLAAIDGRFRQPGAALRKPRAVTLRPRSLRRG